MKYVQMTMDMLNMSENVGGGYGKTLHLLRRLKSQRKS